LKQAKPGEYFEMEKVLQILAVFALLMLIIWRSIRGREDWFRRFSFVGRARQPLGEEVQRRLVKGVFGGEGGLEGGREAFGVPVESEAFLWDEESGMLLVYWRDGKLVIYRRMVGGRNRELQELAVPMDCSGITWDPEEQKIFLEEGGDYFVYGPEG
jgi:hypothetical protein